jgi:hypothetical protein
MQGGNTLGSDRYCRLPRKTDARCKKTKRRGATVDSEANDNAHDQPKVGPDTVDVFALELMCPVPILIEEVLVANGGRWCYLWTDIYNMEMMATERV